MLSVQMLTSLALLSALLMKYAASVVNNYRVRKQMPPGPPGLPLLGNIFQLTRSPWLRFVEWKDHYGSIFSLNLAGQPTVVINDFTTAADLLDRRSHIYSSRPRFIVANEILTGNMILSFMEYGPLWRKMRRAAHEAFNIRSSQSNRRLQEKGSVVLASSLLEDSSQWEEILQRSTASTVLCAIYDQAATEMGLDAIGGRVGEMLKRLSNACLPGRYLVEYFPMILHLPDMLAKWKREGKEFFKKDTIMFEGLMDSVRMKMNAGETRACLATALIEDEKNYDLGAQKKSLASRNYCDDWYNGYLIPKGTLVIWNTWGMNRDPKYFPDYEEFRPERYLDDAGQLSEPIPDTHAQGHFTYGSGKRYAEPLLM
ncbi:hypothetical protein EW026_g4018 [Hermanssonia centrifuga]|uniref:Cytochrome P450 n=1 Tax=Hermanssonia centrifuga TaxID=98765 RepID=A0A4S4KIF8_9APHY|nr:hypothetical protein EW026_g4018 [Hermanssonia centrifuga]